MDQNEYFSRQNFAAALSKAATGGATDEASAQVIREAQANLAREKERAIMEEADILEELRLENLDALAELVPILRGVGFPELPRKEPRGFAAARAHAAGAAARYFAALAGDLPYDIAPGNVALLDEAVKIHYILEEARGEGDDHGFDSALRAGYLLGVEIGRRLGGAR
jgi:hypothetical protein